MEAFRIKNGITATRYLGSNGTETAGSVGYALSEASYNSVSFSVTTQDTLPRRAIFNNDGTKMYMLGASNTSVYQYSLSTAFDVSTASYDSVSFNVGSTMAGPFDVTFNNNGTKMYILAFDTDAIHQYTLSTAFDLSTISYDNVSFSVASQDTLPRGLTFNTDGTKLYLVGDTNNSIYQYSLSTAFDVSTASYDSVSFSVATQDTSPSGIAFNTNGFKMYVVGFAYDSVYQYSLTTAFDLSTTSYDNVSFSVASQDTTLYGLAFNSAGTKMYILGGATDTIYQYSTALLTQTLDLSTGTTFSFTPSGATTVSFTNPPASGNAIGFSVEINGNGSAITWPDSVKWHEATAPVATATKELYTFVTTKGGTTYYGKKAAEGVA